MMQPLISVIVPIYNVEPYLNSCVQSIVGQTYQNLEIILIDDGSPDACPKMCDLWAVQDNRIKVIHKTNSGVSSARNAGILAARGEYIVFVDADDIISSRMIETLLEIHPNQTTLAAVSMQRFSEELPEDSNDGFSVKTAKKTDLVQLRGGLYVWGALYNRNIIEQNGLLFSEALHNLEDVLWNMIYLQYIDNIAVTSNQLYYYRHNPSSITSHCVDRAWQVSCWCKVRYEFCNWVSTSAFLKSELSRWAFRHIQNNLHGECVAGNISFKQYHLIDIESYSQRNPPFLSFISLPEQCVLYFFPQCYFICYKALILFKKKLRGKK